MYIYINVNMSYVYKIHQTQTPYIKIRISTYITIKYSIRIHIYRLYYQGN